MSDTLPDMFVAEAGCFLRTYRITARRSDAYEEEWFMESVVSIPLVGEMARYAQRPVDEDHVRHIYEDYEVVREE